MKRYGLLGLVLLFSLISVNLVNADYLVNSNAQCEYWPDQIPTEQCSNFVSFLHTIGIQGWECQQSIPSTCNAIPEFSTLTAGIALISASGLFLYVRKGKK